MGEAAERRDDGRHSRADDCGFHRREAHPEQQTARDGTASVQAHRACDIVCTHQISVPCGQSSAVPGGRGEVGLRRARGGPVRG